MKYSTITYTVRATRTKSGLSKTSFTRELTVTEDTQERVDPPASGCHITHMPGMAFVHAPKHEVEEYKTKLFNEVEDDLLRRIEQNARELRATRKFRKLQGC